MDGLTAAAESGGSRFGEVWQWEEVGGGGEMASGCGGGSKKRYCGVADLGSRSKKRWDARAYRAWIGESYRRKLLEAGIITSSFCWCFLLEVMIIVIFFVH